MRRGLAALILTSALVSSAAVSDDLSLTPREHRRPADQTYLTFPEWFLVHSPNEFARFTAEHSPSRFPFLGHVEHLWSSYAAVIDATADYELNVGYHAMILVIGISTTVEYAIRAGYETLFGRLAEATEAGTRETPEERFGALVAQEYVDFINVRPWYEFDFIDALERLWSETPPVGPNMIRKWERRYMLTTEYAAKAAYGWFIGLGTSVSYEPAAEVTAVVLADLPASVPEGVDLEVLERRDDGLTIALLPRYQAFGDQAIILARAGVRFVEVAGNRGPILISALVPSGTGQQSPGRVLFVQPILTRPEEERVAFEVPVADLSSALLELRGARHLEHVYDF